MKKLLTFLLLIATMCVFAQDPLIKGELKATKRLKAEQHFIWQGDTIRHDLVLYGQLSITKDSIRFRTIDDEVWSDWYTNMGSGGTFTQVNADWDATSGVAEILNKPGLFDGTWSSLTGKPTFATVATSGSYTDLIDKPTIPAAQVQSDWTASSGLGVILNKPTIPAAQVQSDWTAASGIGMILNKPYIPVAIWDLSGIDNTGWATGKILKFNEYGSLVVGNDEVGTGGTGITYGDLGATSPLAYNSSTGVFSVATGYTIPTTVEKGHYDTAYNDKINSAAFSGTTTKTLTLTQQSGSTLTANFTDNINDADYWPTNEAQSFTASGTSSIGLNLSAVSSTGGGSVFFVGSGGVSLSRSSNVVTIAGADASATNEAQTLTPSGTSVIGFDLSAISGVGGGSIFLQGSGGTTISRSSNIVTINSSTSGGTVPSAGLAKSDGTNWMTSIPDYSANWTEAYNNMGKVNVSDEYTPRKLDSYYFTTVGTLIQPMIQSSPVRYLTIPVSSDGIYNALLTKQDVIMGAATTIVSSNLTYNRALISNSSGKVAVSPNISDSELNNLDNSTSNIQTQLNGKAAKNGSLSESFSVLNVPMPSGYSMEVSSSDNLWGVYNGAGVWPIKVGTYGAIFPSSVTAYEYHFPGSTYWKIKGNAGGGSLEFMYNDGSDHTPIYLTQSGEIHATSVMTATNFQLSDKRLKKNIKPIDYDKFSQLNFVQFVMKSDATNTVRYGVIAQDVERFAPELINTDDKGIKSVNYTDLIIAKMAEMDQRIKDLESEVKYLYKKNKRYEKEFEEADTHFKY